MDRIIVPLDGSELSERALGLGVALAEAYGGQLELVHVVDEPLAYTLMPGLAIPDPLSAERYLQRVAGHLREGLHVTTNVIHGEPVTALLDLTRDAPNTMIVMSTQGRGGLGRLMLGSVTDKVLRGATVPVAVVRGSAPVPQRGLRTILVPLDDSRFSESALPLAADLARQLDATLSLVQVCEPFWSAPSAASIPDAMYVTDMNLSELERENLTGARRYLDLVATERRAQGVRVIWEVRTGKAADEILRATETTDADLIVMATHGRSGIRRWAFGSVTNELLHRGTTPILAIPVGLVERQEQHVNGLLSTM